MTWQYQQALVISIIGYLIFTFLVMRVLKKRQFKHKPYHIVIVGSLGIMAGMLAIFWKPSFILNCEFNYYAMALGFISMLFSVLMGVYQTSKKEKVIDGIEKNIIGLLGIYSFLILCILYKITSNM